MLRLLKHIITLVIVTVSFQCMSQTGFYVPAQANVFFKGDSASIYSNVINNGKLGLGKNAFLHFRGRKWENDPNASITDENNGTTGNTGIISFTDTLPQQIIGGYNSVTKTGASFGNIQINNIQGVFLNSGTTKIRNDLNFKKGLFYLGDNVLVIGNGAPGSITGFDSSHYIVTNNAAGSGLLIRENITTKDKLVAFPIGSRQYGYTPAAIIVSAGAGDDYYATVFDNTRANGATGNLINEKSVNKTWQIGKRSATKSSVQILLQHINSDEGILFKHYRDHSYVSSYSDGSWDVGTPQSAPQQGILTQSSPIASSGVNGRWFRLEGGDHFYTKLYGDTSSAKTKVWLNGYRKDPKTVEVYWFTKPEVNNNYFVIQRRLSNENSFYSIDSLKTQAFNGNSIDLLRYSKFDANGYKGLSYYRLIVVNLDGSRTFTDSIVVSGKAGGNELLLWPNPSTGHFKVGVTGYSAVGYIVVWDILGRKLLQEAVNNRSVIDMYLNRPPGTYTIGFVTYSGVVAETKKLLIVPY